MGGRLSQEGPQQKVKKMFQSLRCCHAMHAHTAANMNCIRRCVPVGLHRVLLLLRWSIDLHLVAVRVRGTRTVHRRPALDRAVSGSRGVDCFLRRAASLEPRLYSNFLSLGKQPS